MTISTLDEAIAKLDHLIESDVKIAVEYDLAWRIIKQELHLKG